MSPLTAGLSISPIPSQPSRQQCDPFRRRGILQVATEPTLNRWLTFEAGCEARDVLFPTLKASWAQAEPSTKPLFPHLVNSSEVHAIDTSALRGKTALLIGDSLARGNTFQFCAVSPLFGLSVNPLTCQLFGEEPVAIDNSHPYSPPKPTDTHPVLDEFDRFPRIDPPAANKQTEDDGHASHYCYIPSLDLMLVQIFTFGMDKDYYWQFRVGT